MPTLEVSVDSSAEVTAFRADGWTEMVVVLEGGAEGQIRMGIDSSPTIPLTNGIPIRMQLAPDAEVSFDSDQASVSKVYVTYTELTYINEAKRTADLLALILQVLAPTAKVARAPQRITEQDAELIRGRRGLGPALIRKSTTTSR